ncbi:MAG: polysaccharide biosynthesis protein GumN [Betaproteobacteria bacterium]|nr:polysaccharide biosynthesis protein GumN [Betaproteobacteria bacterium]
MRQFSLRHFDRPAATRFLIGACALVLAQLMPVAALIHAQSPYDKGLLWRIEKAGAPASHLFGTIHLADKRVTTLSDAVRKEFDAASSFALEVALDHGNVAVLATRMMYTDGRNLAVVAGDPLFRKIVPLTSDLGLPPDMARLFKPWAMVLLLQMPQQDPADVLDFILQRLATEQGKALFSLETIDEQVAAFEKMPEKEQLALLRHVVETHHELEAQREHLLEAYLQRDLGRLWQIGEAELAQRPELRPLKQLFDQRLLYDRNVRMAERMQPLLKTGSAFIAVGALHIYGERGLLALLARDGYRITRVY